MRGDPYRTDRYLLQKHKSLQDLPENGKLILGDAVAEEGRILSIFEKAGVIKLKPEVKRVDARISDIVENPKSCNSCRA